MVKNSTLCFLLCCSGRRILFNEQDTIETVFLEEVIQSCSVNNVFKQTTKFYRKTRMQESLI